MKLALGLVFALVVAAPAYADVSINDSGGAPSHDCATDPVLSLNASSTTLTVTGACDVVSINGSMSTVTIESAVKVSVNGSGNNLTITGVDRLSITGTKNTVTYKQSVTPKKKVKISKTGIGNKVKKVK